MTQKFLFIILFMIFLFWLGKTASVSAQLKADYYAYLSESTPCNYYSNTLPLSGTRGFTDGYKLNTLTPRKLLRNQLGFDYVECRMSVNDIKARPYASFDVPNDNRRIRLFAGTAAGLKGINVMFSMFGPTQTYYIGLNANPPLSKAIFGSFRLPGPSSPYVSPTGTNSGFFYEVQGYHEFNSTVDENLYNRGRRVVILYSGIGDVDPSQAAKVGGTATSYSFPPLHAVAEFIIGDGSPPPTPTSIPAPVLRSVTTNCPCAIR